MIRPFPPELLERARAFAKENGVSLFMVLAAALNAVAPASLGKASAIFNTLRQFGAVFGIAIGTAIFNSKGSLAGPAAVTSGYRPAMAAAAGFSALGAVVAVAIRRRAANRSPGMPAVPAVQDRQLEPR